jgi:O-antigen ligase
MATPAFPREPAIRLREKVGMPAFFGLSVVLALALGLAFPGLGNGTGTTAKLMPVAVIAALGMALIAVTRADWLFVLAFALLAFVRVEPAPVDLAFLLLIIIVAARSGHDSLPLPPSIFVAVMLFLPITILSLINSNDWHVAIKFEAITIYLFALAVFLPLMLRTRGLLAPALKAYILVAAGTAVLGILALQVGFPGGHILIYENSRVMAFFKDPNVFGPFLVPALAIVLEELARPRLLGWGTKKCAVVAVGLAAGVLFSYSRAAILNMVLTLVTVFGVYLWRRKGRRAAMRLGVALALCGIAGISLLVVTHSLTFFESRSHLQAYDQSRFATQGAGFRDASAHVFGYGPGQADTNLDYSTHSIYARIAYEQGFIGLALMILIFLATLIAAIRFVARDGDIEGLGSAALLGAWVGLMANSFFIDTLHWRHLWIFAGLIWFGFMTSQAKLAEEQPQTVALTRSG